MTDNSCCCSVLLEPIGNVCGALHHKGTCLLISKEVTTDNAAYILNTPNIVLKDKIVIR